MRKYLLLLATVGLTLFGGQNALADDMNYSVKADIPENQIGENLSYFDLKMAPGAEQDITVTVSNRSDKKETIDLEVNNAMTNQNGVIDYSQHGKKTDESLKYPVEKLITNNQQKVEFSPGETKKVSFHLKMPKEKIVGTILGGIHISKESEAKKSKKQSVTIENLYSYVLGLQIREDMETVKPVMNLKDVKPTLVNYRTAVAANLQNSTPTILRKVSVDAKVYKKNSQDVLHTTKKENMNVAPNTNFDFPINWDNEPLQPGTYTLKMHVDSDSGEWDFTKDFTIKGKEVKKLNDEAVELKKTDNTLIYVLSGVIIALILAFILFFLYMRRKSKNNEAKNQ